MSNPNPVTAVPRVRSSRYRPPVPGSLNDQLVMGRNHGSHPAQAVAGRASVSVTDPAHSHGAVFVAAHGPARETTQALLPLLEHYRPCVLYVDRVDRLARGYVTSAAVTDAIAETGTTLYVGSEPHRHLRETSSILMSALHRATQLEDRRCDP